jgi:hypothetical protein
MGWVLGGAAAILTWLGWTSLAPALGLPTTDPAAMIDRVLIPKADPGLLGWAVLLGAEALLLLLFRRAVRRRILAPGLLSGTLYGLVVWLLVGALVMPVGGLLTAGTVSAGPSDPMRMSFMMLHLGPLAPLGALLGRLLYGIVLGATSLWVQARAAAPA